jgi:hypothetical protein
MPAALDEVAGYGAVEGEGAGEVEGGIEAEGAGEVELTVDEEVAVEGTGEGWRGWEASSAPAAMTNGDPTDPAEVFPGGLTIWASPGLVTDLTRPDLGAIAALTVVPSLSAHTQDERPGAELIDLIASVLLGQGFQLLAERRSGRPAASEDT